MAVTVNTNSGDPGSGIKMPSSQSTLRESGDTDANLSTGTVSRKDSSLCAEASDNDQTTQLTQITDEAMEKDPENQPSSKPEVDEEPPYTAFPEWKKVTLMLCASFAGMISPMSTSIYYPALGSIAKDVDVSISLINLTITTYLICQAIAPTFVGTFSDIHGRRPAYMICFTIYLGANIGLALQNSYAALMVLRCLQAAGSSGTISLANAVVSDMSTRAERGKYTAYASMGTTLGPSLGPVIGGLLDHFLGWRWIFWFLTILSGFFLVCFIVLIPETCRTVVGNGSVPPQPWNRPLWDVVREYMKSRNGEDVEPKAAETVARRKKRPDLLATVAIVAEKESCLILIYGSLLYAGFMMVMSTLTSQLADQFGFNAIQIGLCYLPFGVGTMASRWTVAPLLDWNFRRQAKKQGLPVVKNKQQDISNFNIEHARLSITIPLIYIGCLFIVGYGWVMKFRTALAGPLVLLFFIGCIVSGSFASLNTLVLDTHRQSPATASAANNLLRCLMGAGATALATPLIHQINIGWTSVFIAAVWVTFSPFLWAVMFRGLKWRKASQKEGEN